jgi:ribosomal protein S27E
VKIEIMSIAQLKSETAKLVGNEIFLHHDCAECNKSQTLNSFAVKDGDVYMILNTESLYLNWECMDCGGGDEYIYAENITGIVR